MKYVLTTLSLTASLIQSLAASERPNIVMIFTDDQRHDAVGYVGNDAVQTPNLDRLARQGLIFQNCFVNTSICAINRANLISGQYPGRHGINDFYKAFTSEQFADSVPGRLRAAGYQTAFFGKWGIGDSPERTHQGAAVFDYWAGQPEQTNYFHEADCRYVKFDGFTRPLDDLCGCPADSRGKAGYHVRIGRENLVDPIHVDSQVTPLHVKRFLDGRDKTRPFCMMLFFKSPHGPFGDWDPSLAGALKPRHIKFPAAATLANAEREPEIVKQSLGWPAGQTLLKNPQRHDNRPHGHHDGFLCRDSCDGWAGYGFVVDRKAPRHGKSLLEKCAGRWKWNEVAEVEFEVRGNRMELCIPRDLLDGGRGLGGIERLRESWRKSADDLFGSGPN